MNSIGGEQVCSISEPEIEQLCTKLIESVQVTIKPMNLVSLDEKRQANEFIEKVSTVTYLPI